MNRRILLAGGLVAGAAIVASAMLPTSPITASAVSTEPSAPVERPSFNELPAAVHGIPISKAEPGAGEYFVFFDPQCPHCSDLWAILEPLRGKTTVTWVPVAFLNKNSLLQGADILSSDDPVQRLTLHEGLMRQRRGGLVVSAGPEASAVEQLKKNAAVLSALGASSVPYVWGRTAAGAMVTMTGAGPQEVVLEKLGLTAVQ